MHEVALIELHVSVETPPVATPVGYATKVAIGMTLTTVDTLLVPPVPMHDKEYKIGIVSAPVLFVPIVAIAPLHLPEAVHEVALVELHVNVEALPLATDVGFAD